MNITCDRCKMTTRRIDPAAAILAASAAIRRHDYAEADRIRNAVFASGAWEAMDCADAIGLMIALARGQEPWAPVAEIRRVA